MFRPSDVRRVQAAFDEGLEAPYEAQVQLENMRKTLRVEIMDPDDETLPVAQSVWWFNDLAPKTAKQPAEAELGAIVASMRQVCTEYPAAKLASIAEKAERDTRLAANLAARQADAEATEAAEAAAAAAAAEAAAVDVD